MTDCPSCGRYVGPYDACPYCGARLSGRVRIRAVKIVAILCATVGLAVLWFLATRSRVPLVQVEKIGATMNMAYVRLAGRCIGTPSYDPDSGYLSFWIDDGSGEIRVASYRAETDRIIELGRIPALGDQVDVAGTVRVRDDVPALVINAPEHLDVVRAVPSDRVVRDIGVDDQFQRVRIRGQVREVRQPYSGLTLITVHDGTGSVPVVVSHDLVALSGPSPAFAPGQSVEVVAAVSVYRDEPQLVPASTADILSLPNPVPIADEVSIGQVSVSDVGNLVVVRGTVTEQEAFSSGIKLTLDDGTGHLTVVLWQSVHAGVVGTVAPEMGMELQVLGEVDVYRGELEIVPQLAADVQILGAMSDPPYAPDPTLEGTSVPVRAQTSTATPRTTATALPTGVPQSTPGATAGPSTTPAAPPVPAPTPTPTSTIEPQVFSIGAVTADRTGEEVTIEGDVVAAASFSSGFKFTLSDGTGELVLLMWHEVYDSCWDAEQINLGARLRATGKVALYDGELQLQPNFGGDVKAISRASPWAPQTDIGSLGGGDVGQRVMIEGHVIRVEGLEGAVKVFLGDETGEVVVFLWRNVLDRVAQSAGLGTVGTRVRVIGTLEVYRSNLEVIPALPVDVIVLAVP